MANKIIKMLTNWFTDWGFGKDTTDFLVVVIIVLFIGLICILLNFLTRKLIHNVLKQIIKRTKNTWDDILFQYRVFHRFSHIVPAVIIYYSADLFLTHYKAWLNFAHSAIYIYVTIVFMIAFSAFLNALNSIYMNSPTSAHRPIKSYLQVVNIFNYSIGIIIILSVIFDKDPSYFLTGIGAIAAVLLIVFKDSLLGLVAGVQLSANDMVKIGDWISMPGKNAEGVVSEISLNTVKVENFDKTITYVPSYALVSESFINWRSMETSRARRIMRSLNIDIKTVRFLSSEDSERLKKHPAIAKVFENISSNKQEKEGEKEYTNLGIFRKYCELFIKEHPAIRQDLSVVSRELQPTTSGIPVEIYCFCKEIDFKSFEEVQSEIFEHFIAITPEFGLKLFQHQSSTDNININ